MASNNIFFIPSDVSSSLDISEWTNYLTNIIIDIRNGIGSAEISQRNKVIAKIQDLLLYVKQNPISKESSALVLFNVYTKIIKISLELRIMLQKYVPSIDPYNEINYALYYDNQRYFVDHLKAEWLSVNSKGQLMLQMDLAIKDLQQMEKEGKNTQIQKIREILYNHYKYYLSMIKGTYHGIFGDNTVSIGKKGAKINLGRVSEGFEEHLVEHHQWMYKNNTELTEDSPIYLIEDHNKKMKQWRDHESVTEGWMHIRHSLGTQRGTVAGDVGNVQVKQIQSTGISSFDRIRLASLANLMDGIKYYSKILDTSKDPQHVAFEIARYLTEPVSKKAADMLNIKANETYTNILPPDLQEARKKRAIILHI